ncbi:rRNA biogenesis protein rrp5 [Ceratobasidium sp. 394]|nr:rRNA biogenesis protein rrp5 [Ceratobasidium sp. 394]
MEAWSKMKMDNRAAAVIRAYCKEYVAPAPVKDAMVVMDEADSTWFSNLASFAKREEMRGARWSADETEMFYWVSLLSSYSWSCDLKWEISSSVMGFSRFKPTKVCAFTYHTFLVLFLHPLCPHFFWEPKKKKRNKEAEGGVKLSKAYPIGMILESVHVTQVESEWGLISRIADLLVPQLSSASGAWQVGSTHHAWVTGHHALDGLVQLGLQPSVLELVYMRAGDGMITKLKENRLLAAFSDKVTGFVGPDHYADIRLKHPERKFKQGATVKCRILNVDSN